MDWISGPIFGFEIEHREIKRPAGKAYYPIARTGKGVLHTTEGRGLEVAWDTLAAHTAAPHFLIGENRIIQCRPLGVQSAALVDPGNRLAEVQIENCGFTGGSPDWTHHAMDIWQLVDTTFKPLSALMAFLAKQGVIPLQRAHDWPDDCQDIKWLNIYSSNGDGTTKIAVASASYDATNATTQKTFIANGATDTIGDTQVLVGQKVLIFDPTGTTQRVGTVGASALTVASKTKTTVVMSAALPSDYINGDILVPEGSTPATALKGVPYIVANSGSYFGLSRSSVDSLQSVMVAAGGGLSQALLMQTYNQIRQRTGASGLKGEGKIELCTNITQHAAYYALTTTAPNVTHFVHDKGSRPQIDVGGDSEEFTWFGAPLNCFLDFPGSAIYFLNFAYLKTATLKEAGEMVGMPSMDWLQSFNGTTSNYKAAKQQWWDVARDNFSPAPHRHGALTGLTVTGFPQQKS